MLIAIWAGLLITPYTSGGLPALMRKMPGILQNPFRIRISAGSVRTAVSSAAVTALIELSIFSSEKKKRPGAEHGSASWGKASAVNRKYGSANGEGEKILTRNVSINLDGRRHGRNLNVIAVGGSGSGKTRSYAMPNILNADCSYTVAEKYPDWATATEGKASSEYQYHSSSGSSFGSSSSSNYSYGTGSTSSSDDPYDAGSYWDPEDFYYEYAEDFDDYEDAADYWYEHHG